MKNFKENLHSFYKNYVYGAKSDLVAQISGVTYSHASSYPLSKNIYNWRDPKGFFLALYAAASAWFDNPANGRAIFIALLAIAILCAIALWVYTAFFHQRHTLLIPRPLAHVIPGLLVMFFSTFGLTGCFDALFDNGPAGIVHYFHPNHVGSVRMITDRLGNVVAKFRYKPYGELLVDRSFGMDQSKYKYTGQEEDSTTGLYYYSSRFYAPPVGRFISPDSVIPDPTNTQAFNRYMYAYGNPVRYNDPSGSYGEPGYSNPGDPGGYLGMVNAYSEGPGNPSAVSPGANTGSTVYGYGETPSLGARIVAFISGLFNSNGALPPSNVNYNLLEAELNGNEGSISSFLSWVWGKISSNNPDTATSHGGAAVGPGGGWSTFAQYASKGAGYGRLATSSVGLVLRGPTISDFVLNRALTNLPTFTNNSQLAIYGRTLIALDNISKAVPYLGFVFLTISLTSNSYLTYSGQMSPLSFSVNTGVNLLGLAAGPEIGIPLSVLNMMYGQDVVNVTENSANLIYESSHHGSIEGFVGDMIFNLYAH